MPGLNVEGGDLVAARKAVEELMRRAGHIPPAGEPYFVLRGQDAMAAIGIKHYALAIERQVDVPEEKKQSVWKAAFAMDEWQAANKHRVKMPD